MDINPVLLFIGGIFAGVGLITVLFIVQLVLRGKTKEIMATGKETTGVSGI